MGEKNTTDVLFKRDTLENVNNTPLKDGQVLWTIDQEGNDKIYNDVKQSDGTIKRTQIGGTIQVDQDFDKDSPYPLANKKIVDALKDFIPAYAYNLPILESALLVNSETDAYELNKVQPVYRGITKDLPTDLNFGVREVIRYAKSNVSIKIIGCDINGITSEWFNNYQNNFWSGWSRATTNSDLFIGYDSSITGSKYAVKLQKPTLTTKDNDFCIIAKNDVNLVFNVDYKGNVGAASYWIKDAQGVNYVLVDNERKITANNLIISHNITSNTITSNTIDVSVTNAQVINSSVINSSGVINANGGIVVPGNRMISSNDLLQIYGGNSVQIRASAASGITYYDDGNGGAVSPDQSNVVALGTHTSSWEVVYTNRLEQTSDKKLKSHIAYLSENNKLKDFYMNLKPAEYKWRENGHRVHLGFYAQDIAENANKTIGDLSLYQAVQVLKDENGKIIEKPYNKNIDDKDLRWTLSYTELIAPTVAMVQKQQKEIEELKQQIKNLKR